jgi:hypothetical protein
MPNFSGRNIRATSASAHWRAATVAAAVLVLLTMGMGGVAAAAPAGGAGPGQKPRVLTVGTLDGKRGEFQSIQAAVDAASPGDWIVIAPGDYKERGDYTTHPPGWAPAAGVFIDKPDLHLLGLSRGGVVVDGTKSGPPCSASPADQDHGPAGPSGPWGRNGIEVYQASGVTIQNLTVCNFLSGQPGSGNQIWWNGGYRTGQVHMRSYHGSYLSATTTYFRQSDPAQAAYGVFAANASGPGLIDHSYASNMNDSGFYVGACPDCNAILDHIHAENSPLGVSASNASGHLVIRNGEFDRNGIGIVTNSESNGDLPAPQDGACPGGSGSCWVVTGNYFHDNNNRDVPGNGLGLVGVGMLVLGGRHDTITGNLFARNGAWAAVADIWFSGVQNGPADCTSGGGIWDNPYADTLGGGPTCFFSDFGNVFAGNVFAGNGFFGQPTNGDLADLSDFSAVGIPAPAPGQGNCWHGNIDPSGVTSWPAGLQQTNGNCATGGPGGSVTGPLVGQLFCNYLQLPPSDPLCGGAVYPQQDPSFSLLPLPPQPAMPDPCSALPRMIPWCAPGPGRI